MMIGWVGALRLHCCAADDLRALYRLPDQWAGGLLTPLRDLMASQRRKRCFTKTAALIRGLNTPSMRCNDDATKQAQNDMRKAKFKTNLHNGQRMLIKRWIFIKRLTTSTYPTISAKKIDTSQKWLL